MQINKKIPLIFGVPDASFYNSLNEKKVFVAELRPGLEGMKIVASRLLEKHIQPVIICDNMMAFCMQRGFVKKVFIFSQTGAQKKNICRTGSLIAALAAKKHKIPVYLFKTKAVLLKASSLLKINGQKVTSAHIKTYVPLLEEVPGALVKGS